MQQHGFAKAHRLTRAAHQAGCRLWHESSGGARIGACQASMTRKAWTEVAKEVERLADIEASIKQAMLRA